MNILNIKFVKEKINLVKNYFRKFSLKQKIIGISTILVALVISSYFSFFYESEEEKLKIILEEKITNFAYADFDFPEIRKKFITSGGKISSSYYETSDFYKDIYDTITKNGKVEIELIKTSSKKYDCLGFFTSYKVGEAGILFFKIGIQFELIGDSEHFIVNVKNVFRDVYRLTHDGIKTDMITYNHMGKDSRNCWGTVEYEK